MLLGVNLILGSSALSGIEVGTGEKEQGVAPRLPFLCGAGGKERKSGLLQSYVCPIWSSRDFSINQSWNGRPSYR